MARACGRAVEAPRRAPIRPDGHLGTPSGETIRTRSPADIMPPRTPPLSAEQEKPGGGGQLTYYFAGIPKYRRKSLRGEGEVARKRLVEQCDIPQGVHAAGPGNAHRSAAARTKRRRDGEAVSPDGASGALRFLQGAYTAFRRKTCGKPRAQAPWVLAGHVSARVMRRSRRPWAPSSPPLIKDADSHAVRQKSGD